jgi:hypothetical protein
MLDRARDPSSRNALIEFKAVIVPVTNTVPRSSEPAL